MMKNIHNKRFLNKSVDIFSLIDCPKQIQQLPPMLLLYLETKFQIRTKTSVDKYPNKTGIHPTNKKKPIVSTNSPLWNFSSYEINSKRNGPKHCWTSNKTRYDTNKWLPNPHFFRSNIPATSLKFVTKKLNIPTPIQSLISSLDK